MGAEAALAAFEGIFESNSVEVQEVVAIWGIHPREGFEVYDGISLAAIDSLPPSVPRDILLGIPTWASFTEEEGGFHVRARPQAVLTHGFRLSPVVSAAHIFAKSGEPVSRIDEMIEIARCMTLISSRKIEQIGSWFQTDLELPLVGGVSGWGGQAINWQHQFAIEPEDLDVGRIRAIISGYFSLPASDRRRLRIVLDRLNAAKSNGPLEDRAIDLGISLEALLFNPDEKQPELTFKFKMRGSFLSADEPADRRQAFSLLDRIYSHRSRAAHGGSFDTEKVPRVRRDIEEGAQLASTLIQRVLALGQIPENWNGLILGWAKFDG
jgi:hypothetical protein